MPVLILAVATRGIVDIKNLLRIVFQVVQEVRIAVILRRSGKFAQNELPGTGANTPLFEVAASCDILHIIGQSTSWPCKRGPRLLLCR